MEIVETTTTKVREEEAITTTLLDVGMVISTTQEPDTMAVSYTHLTLPTNREV